MPNVIVKDIPIAYDVKGDGTPVMLVAGTGYPGATWLPQAVDVLAREFKVITFDHRGTGNTPGTPGPYSTRQFAADALGLLQVLETGPTHVIGHSMGGRVAQWMALDRPDMVRSLVLAATGPGQFSGQKPVTRGIPLHTGVAMVEAGYEGYMKKHIRETFFTREFAEESPETVEWLVKAFWENRPSLEEYLKHVIARQQHQTAELLDRITCPALVMVGDRDTHMGGTGVHTEQSQYLLEHLPHAELKVINGAAHGYFWQLPEDSMTAVADWLRER